jgi:Holliday junction resolvasome RuvABC ATP-dependent DNA helicase subunit
MNSELYTILGSDLDCLVERISELLNSGTNLDKARRMLKYGDAPGEDLGVVFSGVTTPDISRLRTIVVLAIGGDILDRLKSAIMANSKLRKGEISREEMRVVYTIARAIASIFAQCLLRYSQYDNLPYSEYTSFLKTFAGDNEPFGGGRRSPTLSLGAVLSFVATELEPQSKALDHYERIIATVMQETMQFSTQQPRQHEAMQSFLEFVGELKQDAFCEVSAGSIRASPTAHEKLDSQTAQATNGDDAAAILHVAMTELDALIGLQGVKSEVKRLMNFLKIQQQRRKHGIKEAGQTLHFVFTGNPGTGKTTVARIISKIFFGFNLPKTTNVVECDRSKLVGGYIGQTAIKTDEVIESALDGVLFVDEAYTLSSTWGSKDFGQEAIDTLVKRMEDYRGRLIVIVAGYPKLMETFVNANPGLKSRFTRFIMFEDYRVPDMTQIFEKLCNDAEYQLTPAGRAAASLLFTLAYNRRDERFGNGRFVRNVFEQATSRQSQRLAETEMEVGKEALLQLDGADIPLELISDLDTASIDLQESKWEAECPGCGKTSRGGVPLLGERVTCRCGHRFVFPWWNLVPNSVKGVPVQELTLQRPPVGPAESGQHLA